MLIFSLLFVGLAHAQPHTHKSADCEVSGFTRGPWQQIIEHEPRIHEALQDIANASGETGVKVPMTNCWVKWPINEKGEPVDGLRYVILDKIWNGGNAHGGIKIVYHLGWRNNRRYRDVRGFAVCGTSEVCREFAIPFPNLRPTPGSSLPARPTKTAEAPQDSPV